MIMPGLGQLLNRQYLKAIVFLIGEHILNFLAKVNKALYLDLNGFHREAVEIVHIEFAMFYPGFYVLCVLDSVINAGKTEDKRFINWFALAGLIGTVGVIFSPRNPFMPVFSVGVFMVIFMLVGSFVCRKYNPEKG
ncbi:hypothetical protein KO561_03685 [Radiobacillus kanasensis]|uniref:hypothetical protein n=1 Tax=Radiobacillus kanasensis TaxID=2844358 RepID=UPI001E62C936|nr:hypothetical protein [Radiobacillus kanasensis]UFU00077.1 hypothetical protein KO561_03685 [Radiobacillus kanasensis]